MPLTQEQLTDHIYELHQRIAEHQREIGKLENEIAQSETERLQHAPRGLFLSATLFIYVDPT